MGQSFSPLYLKSGDIESRSISDFQVFSERCSGSNFVKSLIENNLDVNFRNQYGWKHGFPSMIATKPNSVAIGVFRNPENWLRSLHRRPWHVSKDLKSLPFSEFIRAEWSTIVNKISDFKLPNDGGYQDRPLLLDRDPVTGAPFANIIKLRDAKNRGLWSLANRFDNVILVRYEDVVANQRGFVELLSAHFGLGLKDSVAPIGTYKGRSDGKPFVKKIYPDISQADANFIWSTIDIEMEKKLGYFIK